MASAEFGSFYSFCPDQQRLQGSFGENQICLKELLLTALLEGTRLLFRTSDRFQADRVRFDPRCSFCQMRTLTADQSKTKYLCKLHLVAGVMPFVSLKKTNNFYTLTGKSAETDTTGGVRGFSEQDVDLDRCSSEHS